MLETARLLASSPREFLERNFESPEIRATLAAWGMHLDFSPDIAGGALFPYLESMANQSFGMVIGAGGADTMIKAMVARLEALGGVVRLNSEVVEVETRRRTRGRHPARERRDGRREARRDRRRDAHGACRRDSLPAASAMRATIAAREKFRYGPGTMMVHLAMSGPARLVGGRGAEALRLRASRARPRHDGARLFGGDGGAASGRAGARRRPADGDRSVARAGGKAILWVQVRVLPATIRGDAAGKINDTPDPKKGLATCLRAFAIFVQENPHAELFIAGKGPLQPTLEALVAELGIGASVHFTGFLSQSDLLALYHRCHIFMHPSEMPADENQEGIPNSILEAMATGMPVLATRHGGIPEAVESGRCGALVAERDFEALAAEMKEITRSPRSFAEMGVLASEAVAANFEQRIADRSSRRSISRSGGNRA